MWRSCQSPREPHFSGNTEFLEKLPMSKELHLTEELKSMETPSLP